MNPRIFILLAFLLVGVVGVSAATSYYAPTNAVYGSSASWAGILGGNVTLNTTVHQVIVEKISTSTATTSYILDSSGNVLSYAAYSGDNATHVVTLSPGYYYVGDSSNGSARTQKEDLNYPGEAFDLGEWEPEGFYCSSTSGTVCNTGINNNAKIFNIVSATFIVNATGPTFVSLTAVDSYAGSSITTFNASLTNTSGTYDFSTTNGTINTNIEDTTGPYNITFSAANYFSNTSASVDVSSGSVQGSLVQAYVSFLCFEKHTNTSLTCAQPGPLPRQADSYTDQVNVTGYHPVDYSYTLSALDNETFSVYGFYDHELTVTAEDYLGASLSNFTLWVNSSLVNYTVTDNNTGSVELGLLQGYNYTIEITENVPAGVERNNSIESTIINVPEDPSSSTQSYQFNLTFPSLTITVLDEDTGVNAPGNTTLTFTASNTSFTKTVVNGLGVFNASDSIPSGSYSVRFENDDYADRVYNLTYNREFPQSLTAYLVNTSSPNVVFILENRDTRNVVESATITVQRFINGTLTTVNVLETDITGRTAFDYLSNTEYRFQITHADYTAKNFTLNPILFSSYTILMDSPTTVGETTGDYSGIGFVFNTVRFVEGSPADLSATVSDALGSLVSYGFNITVNGVGIDSQSGSNAYGSILTSNANIPETPFNGTAVIDYYYQRSDGITHTFRAIYSVEQVNAYSNQTWVGNREIAADIPILDRIVVVTIILAAVGALAFTFGGLTTAAIGMMLIMGFFSFTGFINGWVFAVPIIGLFFLLIGREAQ